MAGTRDARRRILDATTELVASGGLPAATPAAIAERAGAGKMSLYRHFAGKDELVAEALAERDPAQRALLIGEPTNQPARERLLAVFDRGAGIADRGGRSFIGCPYVSARLDLPDDGHPAAPVIRAHKEGMLRELAAMLAEIGVADPDETANIVLMLLDGAIIHAVIRGNGDPLREARAAVPALLEPTD
jgi:AcrR family transcriptional regulator